MGDIETYLLIQNLTNMTSLYKLDISGMSAEELIQQYCTDLHTNVTWFLGLMVTMWFIRYGWKQYIKYRYIKKGLVVPKNTAWFFSLLSESLDLFQSTYILIVFVLAVIPA